MGKVLKGDNSSNDLAKRPVSLLAAGLKIPLAVLLLAAGAAGLAQSPDTTDVLDRHEDLTEVLILEERVKNAVAQHAFRYGLEDKLKALAPINLVARGPYARELMYRGQSGNRTQVRVDGMRVYMACTDRMDPPSSYVATNNLAEIALQDPTEGALQSGQAGAVNLKTARARLGKRPEWRWNAGLRGQTNGGGAQAMMNLERRKQNWAVRLNGSWQKRTPYIDGRGQKVDFTQYEKQNWALSGVYRLSPQDKLQAQVVYDRAVDVGYPSLPMDVGLARGVISSISYLSSRNWGPFAGGRVKVYFNDIFHEMDDTQRPHVPMHMDMPGWSRTYGLNARTGQWSLGQHQLKAQAELYHNYRRAEMTMYPEGEPSMFMLTWPDARLSGAALALTHQWKLKRWYLDNSLRLGGEETRVSSANGQRQWEAQGYEVEEPRRVLLPQLGIKMGRDLGARQSLEASFSYGLRGPTTPERYGYYLFNAADGYDYLGNPDLRPERLATYALAYKLRQKNGQVKGEAYWQAYRDYIFGAFEEGSPLTARSRGIRRYANEAAASFWGLSAQGQWQLNAWNLRGTLKWNQGQLSDGEYPPLLPPLQGSVNGAYSFKEHWQVGGQLRWALAQRRFNRDFRERATPGYALADCRVAYRGLQKSFDWELALAGRNLLDQYYFPHTSINRIASPGRNLVLELKVMGK